MISRQPGTDDLGRASIFMLDYEQRSKRAHIRPIWVVLGMTICIFAIFCGLVAVWYGSEGIRYAIVNAPSRDRSGDIFGAGILTLIGVLFVIFGGRWAWQLYRRMGS
jgi:hypothetical protein